MVFQKEGDIEESDREKRLFPINRMAIEDG